MKLFLTICLFFNISSEYKFSTITKTSVQKITETQPNKKIFRLEINDNCKGTIFQIHSKTTETNRFNKEKNVYVKNYLVIEEYTPLLNFKVEEKKLKFFYTPFYENNNNHKINEMKNIIKQYACNFLQTNKLEVLYFSYYKYVEEYLKKLQIQKNQINEHLKNFEVNSMKYQELKQIQKLLEKNADNPDDEKKESHKANYFQNFTIATVILCEKKSKLPSSDDLSNLEYLRDISSPKIPQVKFSNDISYVDCVESVSVDSEVFEGANPLVETKLVHQDYKDASFEYGETNEVDEKTEKTPFRPNFRGKREADTDEEEEKEDSGEKDSKIHRTETNIFESQNSDVDDSQIDNEEPSQIDNEEASSQSISPSPTDLIFERSDTSSPLPENPNDSSESNAGPTFTLGTNDHKKRPSIWLDRWL